MATPSTDDLLAHTDWLTQLARALVGDAAAADVVQETFEVALSKPPREDGPLRPWLGGVARNIARMTTRSRVRREARELAVPVTADVPTPEELVARVQMQQRVAKIVLELHEPLRATLLLRFFEGLDASEIARAQGVPASTVRSRLKDALDRVRATLDVEHGGDRRRWAVLLAPLPAMLPKGGVVLAGGIVVKKIVIGLVLVAAVVVGTRLAGLWGKGADDAKKPAVAAKPTTGSAAKPVTPATAPAAPARMGDLPTWHDDDPKGVLRLEGQVIDEKDAPVAKAMVAIDANPPIVVETEADGSFVFEGLIPRDYRLEATAGDGYAGPARLRLGEKPEPVTLRLKRGGIVEVTVTDRAGGAVVKGAEVELRSALTWKATTNADGVATLKGVGAVWAPLAVRANGYAPAAMMFGTAGDPAGPERVTIALARGAAINGRVVDDQGKPVGGARVVATSASEPLPVVDPRRDGVVASADGKFSIPAVAPGTWRLSATHGDFAPTTSEPIVVDGVNARSGVEIKLAAGGVVRGIVKDKEGKPVAAADVRVVAQGFVFWRARRQAFTDADGKFEINGLARRAVDVVAQHDAGASAIVPADLAAKREHDVALVLDVAGTIAGTVVDAKGAPIGDAQVSADPVWSGGTVDRVQWNVRGVQEAVTDQTGAFKFAGLPDGTYRVRAARPAASEAQLSLSTGVEVKPNGAPIKIVVATDGRIVGKVQLADGKTPPRYNMMLGWTHPAPFSAKDGSFSMTAPPGKHTLTINGIGFVEQRKEVTIAEGKDTDLGTITVAGGRSVSGRVLDESGAPVAKAKVAAGTLLTGGGAELYIKDESINAKDADTDENGRFVIDGFSPMAVTIVAGNDKGRSPSLRIPAGPDSVTVDLVLSPTTGLDGKIMQNGKPLGDTVVIANPVGATSSNFFVVTGADGTFALDTLAPGSYVIYPMLGGGGGRPKDMYTRKVEVALGARTKVEIDTTPGPTTVTVAIKNDKGDAVAMAGIGMIGAHIDVKSVDQMRDYSMLHKGDQVIPIYMRTVMGGTVDIPGVRTGPVTACAIFGNPMTGDPATVKFKCLQTKVGAGAKQTITITVPAAWFE
ncbi:MAG: sigma-70 family RNA polymerase sigma factor [Deltaproteobacteria bacterium]|nr:sigma-70 family RNA polymerase sigma factor [Deltaproteobacteria bacterium]